MRADVAQPDDEQIADELGRGLGEQREAQRERHHDKRVAEAVVVERRVLGRIECVQATSSSGERTTTSPSGGGGPLGAR